ncbi:uncharacterized protein LOC119770582 [Culex quinquefasciatus]|uniref:uncharacterized protein LOC119770582 n=1 Tax=Culex quinquefasciatus TaxID=7176 RepID=UPI0018E3303D|nr:uncharacterized protein LOC119770582 [Culex quinquefasciatus]
MVQKFLEVIKPSPRICHVLALIYTVLSLAGSILVLKYRRDWVEKYNEKELITDESTRVIVFLFGLYWLISNGFLLFGFLSNNVTFKKIHLYFVVGLFVGVGGVLLIGFLIGLNFFVRQLDKAETSWLEMTHKSINLFLGMTLFASMIAFTMILCIAAIHYILIGGINPNHKACQFDENLEEKEELDSAGEVEEEKMSA